ncbi:MAG: YHYH protein [Gammaproteobacteria bacterium]|nr:YHYH protein [Gammaproteobacteria bacterium]
MSKVLATLQAPLAALVLVTLSGCGGGVTRTATGAASPITVTGLANGTAYSCSVTATNSIGNSAPSGAVQVTPTTGATTYNTDGVLCAYSVSEFNNSPSVNASASAFWSCNPNRALVANAIPNHAVGTFPNANNPNPIRAQQISATFPLRPAIANANGNNVMVPGHAINGVKFEPGTGGTCDGANPPNCTAIGGTGAWRMEALAPSAFNFGTDSNNAHVQPTGEYHYHGLPTGLINKLGKGTAMTLVGWAADGFPIYARYGYSSANDATSAIKELVSSWRIKATPDSGRPATTLYPMGSFLQDYEYAAGLGDLDQCNGRTGVTPEFPNGIYYYVITQTFPFVGRCIRGSTSPGA